jgi:putative addiction module component (TIGR02574 family)
MTATTEVEIDAILELPVAQRIEVAHAILESIAADTARPPLTEEFKQELRRRRDEARAHPEDGISWEVIKAESLARSQG